MKCLITGAHGQLGYDVTRELKLRGYDDIVALGHEDMDITDAKEVQNVITSIRPDVVFHCAAYTKVDQAEDEEDICKEVNQEGSRQIAIACKEIDAKLIYISTDYVFDGEKTEEYTIEDIPNPKNVYGMSKYLGEQYSKINPKTYIVRISWVFGINGKNFIKTMLKLAQDRNEISVVCDQIGSPTYTVDLARLLVDMAESEKYGTYHATNEGFCSWADLAEYIFKMNGLDITIHRIPTSNYPQKAQRPLNSKLSKDKLEEMGFDRLPDWHDAVNRFNLELEKNKVLKK